MHHEILEDLEIRNAKFTKGQVVIEGDFPVAEFAPWVMAGKVKRHEDAPIAAAAPVPKPRPQAIV